MLFNQFKFFFNFFFLLITLSQFIPSFKVGFLFTYVAPLAFVLFVTMAKEAHDDFKRWQRDKDLNGSLYEKIGQHNMEPIKSKDIKVGDIIKVKQNQRVPADLILFHTTEKTGSVFIKTD